MALVLKDRVKQTASAPGTGTITLSGSVAGFQSFATVGNGNTTYFAIVDPVSGDWEVNYGVYTSSGTTLTRNSTPLSSSNGGALVNFTGTVDVFVTYPSENAVWTDTTGVVAQQSFGAITATSAALTTGTVSTTPTANTDIANKQYVDTISASGIHYHDPVYVEVPNTFGNLNATYNNGASGVGATLTNAGTQAAFTADGISVPLNSRVLVYNQTNAAQNGVYTLTTVGSGSTNWVLTRATDANTYSPFSPNSLGQGDAFFVTNGNTGAGETYICNTVGTITFGTTAITFAQISDSTLYTAGTGLTLTGTEFSITNTGVTANTYGSASIVPVITVNAQGQATGITNANIAITGSQVSGNIAGSAGSVANALTLGSYLTGTSYNGSAAVTAAVDATSANTASKVVARDASGNFSAGTITATLSGAATSATTATNIAGGAANQIPYQTGAATTSFITAPTTAGTYLGWNGSAFTYSAISTPNAVTFNNGGTGDASGTTFNGSVARTISYNTVGASPLAGSSSLTTTGTVTSGTWSASFGAVSGANLTNLTAGNLSGTIPSAVLGNSTHYIGTTAVALNRASANQALTGISSVAFPGSTSGTTTLQPSAVAGATTITMPATTGTMALTSDVPTVNNGTLTMGVSGTGLSGSATFTANQAGASTFTVTSNATNANTASTIVARDASGNFSAGTITATLSGQASSVANSHTAGTYLTGSAYNGSAAQTWSVDATSANTASKVVARDGSGNFSAGTITATLNGNATSATTATTATSATTATTATTATNQSGGTVSATTGAFTNTLTSNYGYANADNALRIAFPGGASYATSTSSVTGAIKIRIPTAAKASNTMMNFTVKIYQYNTGLSGEIQVGGYNYSDASFSWYNVFATNLSTSLGDLTVRFGYDGTSQCIYIGELASSWSYPQIAVTNFVGGYSGYAASTWSSGWSVGFEASAFAGVTASIIAARTLNTQNYNSYAPTLTGTGASGVWSINVTGSAGSAVSANNLSGGFAGYIPYQAGGGSTAFLAAGTAGYVLQSNGAAAPSWVAPSGGAQAGGVIYENSKVISSNYTLTASKNGMSVGPITVNSGVSVTVPTGQRWVIL